MPRARPFDAAVLALIVAFACTPQASTPRSPTTSAPAGSTASPSSTPAPPSNTPVATASPASSPDDLAEATEAPAWLGTRVLEPGPTGFPPPQPTPPELVPRRIATVDVLPPPPDDEFASTTSAVPDEVAARSTWDPACPVGLDELRHVTVAFWGFDDKAHTGELLVHADVAADVVEVFRRLHEARFPLEEVRIATSADLDAPPTGDGNTTSAFVCRPAVGTTSWSAHALGRAVDVNPFQNPYIRETGDGRIVLPELATAYTDRDLDLPGMIRPDGPVIEAFTDIGWTWGGSFDTVDDLHHFSQTGT